MPKNNKITIARNIRMDRDYINVCDADILSVVNSNAVATATNYSFIRKNRRLKVAFTYAQAIQCNYMAFQNPDYANKWFFAWIDNIEYVGENTVEIEFTIDHFSTWWSSLTKQSVFVDREHVNSDGFGEHTLPEPVNPGTMISQNVVQRFFTSYQVAVFWLPAQINTSNFRYVDIDGLYSPVNINVYPCSVAGLGRLASDLSNTGGELATANIIAVNLIPTDFFDSLPSDFHFYGSHNSVTISNVMPKPTNLNGYVPVNNKCFMHPYTYLIADNGTNEKIYKYEKFANINNGAALNIAAFPEPNGACSIYPFNYDGITGANVAESLTLGDLPMIPYLTDAYAAWLAQKSSATQMQGVMSTLTGILAGGLHGGIPGALIGGGLGAAGAVTNYQVQEETARNEKDRVIGTNNISVDVVKGFLGFTLAQKSCIADDAERIDRFFSQYGYNVSICKTPNYTGRQYWNYVKINGIVGYGAIPEESRIIINSAVNKGLTIWHSHNNIGNYFIGGTKMQNPII